MSISADRATAALEVMVVDDHPALRAALRYTLEREAGLVLRAEAASPDEAMRLARELSPDIAVVDLIFPEGAAFELLRDLHTAAPRTRVVVWSAAQGQWYAHQARRLGARAFVSKSEPIEHLVAAIRLAGSASADPPAPRTAAGSLSLSSTTTSDASSALTHDVRLTNSPREALSDRESKVLELIGRGRTTTEIAAATGRSVKTIETFRYRIKRKLGLNNSLELAQLAFREAQAEMGGASMETTAIAAALRPTAALAPHGVTGGARDPTQVVRAASLEHLLLVSGLRVFRESLAQVLRDRGFQVDAVATTAGAMAILSRALPAAVLLDPAPSRVGRRSLLERLRADEAWASLPVVLFGSTGGGALAARLRTMADELILRNRFDVSDLFATLNRVLAPRRHRPRSRDDRSIPAAEDSTASA